ncbi:MAG: hypothetical protein D9V47_05275 [Clostridia bacterium]|nr:MAG: hypothetical protein D9V47_05275 [Clostridia bacterium]
MSEIHIDRLSKVIAETPDPRSDEREKLFPCYYSHWCPYQYLKFHLGLRDTVFLAHTPQGCVGAERAFESTYTGQYFGEPFYYTPCTDMRENDIILGGADKLREALFEVERVYEPKLIIVLFSCATGMIRDPIDEVVEEVKGKIKAKVVTVDGMGLRNWACGIGYEPGPAALGKLVDPPKHKLKDAVNIVGVTKEIYHVGRFINDTHEYVRLVQALGLKVRAVLWQGATVEDLVGAAEAEFNAIDCPQWGYPLAKTIYEKYGVPHGTKALPLGVEATRRWMLDVARHFGLESAAERVFAEEYARIKDVWEKARTLVEGKLALIDGGDPMGAAGRCLTWARLASELGMRPVIFNIPPLELKGKIHHVNFALADGNDPEIVWTSEYAYHRRLQPWRVLERLGASPDDVGTYVGDVFTRAMAKEGKPVFDPSNSPRVMLTTHMSRRAGSPGRRVGFVGARSFAEDIINTVAMAKKRVKPSLRGRLAGLRVS